MTSPEAASHERMLSPKERNTGVDYLLTSLKDALAHSPGYHRIVVVDYLFSGGPKEYLYTTFRDDGWSMHVAFLSGGKPVKFKYIRARWGSHGENVLESLYVDRGKEQLHIGRSTEGDRESSHFHYQESKDGKREKDSISAAEKILTFFESLKAE
ncbi:MAG: hypothetical protein ACHQT7_02205 [Candidatus Levyibacteriota bacterium]